MKCLPAVRLGIECENERLGVESKVLVTGLSIDFVKDFSNAERPTLRHKMLAMLATKASLSIYMHPGGKEGR